MSKTTKSRCFNWFLRLRYVSCFCIFSLLTKVLIIFQVLDGFNQEGDEVDSLDYGDELGPEEGEDEIEEQLMAQLTEAQKKEMQEKGMTAADYFAS